MQRQPCRTALRNEGPTPWNLGKTIPWTWPWAQRDLKPAWLLWQWILRLVMHLSTRVSDILSSGWTARLPCLSTFVSLWSFAFSATPMNMALVSLLTPRVIVSRLQLRLITASLKNLQWRLCVVTRAETFCLVVHVRALNTVAQIGTLRREYYLRISPTLLL